MARFSKSKTLSIGFYADSQKITVVLHGLADSVAQVPRGQSFTLTSTHTITPISQTLMSSTLDTNVVLPSHLARPYEIATSARATETAAMISLLLLPIKEA